jgi:hypothetical protein
MRSETAAAHGDEPSVEAFLRKVPQFEPTRAKGSLPNWHRWKLDQDIYAIFSFVPSGAK